MVASLSPMVATGGTTSLGGQTRPRDDSAGLCSGRDIERANHHLAFLCLVIIRLGTFNNLHIHVPF